VTAAKAAATGNAGGAEGGGEPDDVGVRGRDQVEPGLPGPGLEFGWRSGGDNPAGLDEHD
jgi:hypothetical protein